MVYKKPVSKKHVWKALCRLVLKVTGKSEHRLIAMFIERFITYVAWLWCECNATRYLRFVRGNFNVIEVRGNVLISIKLEQCRKINRTLLNSEESYVNLVSKLQFEGGIESTTQRPVASINASTTTTTTTTTCKTSCTATTTTDVRIFSTLIPTLFLVALHHLFTSKCSQNLRLQTTYGQPIFPPSLSYHL